MARTRETLARLVASWRLVVSAGDDVHRIGVDDRIGVEHRSGGGWRGQ